MSKKLLDGPPKLEFILFITRERESWDIFYVFTYHYSVDFMNDNLFEDLV